MRRERPVNLAGYAVVVPKDPEETYDFLVRAYRVARLVAVATVSVVGVLAAVAALDIKFSDAWTDVKVPLYGVVLIWGSIAVLFGLVLMVILIMLRDSMSTSSFYRSKAINLGAAVTGLEELAFTDPITGLPNSNALELEIERTKDRPRRCLILIDLQDFRSINNKYNHWCGDEYLRQFSSMVYREGRRNEFVYKRRPPEDDSVDARTYPNADTRPSIQRRLTWRHRSHQHAATGAEPDDPSYKTFRKNQGSDEFYIVLEGGIIDGLGYLNRLKRRAPDFEEMSRRVLGGEVHTFGFYAGVTTVAPKEPFESAAKRAAECLQLARAKSAVRSAFWCPELPEFPPGSIQAKIQSETEGLFAKTP
jgi:hypothetical protein